MKKVLLASTALVFTGGMAMAEVEVSGDGRMGIIDAFSVPDNPLTAADESVANDGATFTSRIRIAFTASGETDGGLTFGGSIRADNAAAGASGTAGSVFVEGAWGKLSMGDVDGAAKSAVGHVSGVGLTGLGDREEIAYIANAGRDPAALYEFSTGDLTLYLSHDKPNGAQAYAVGVSYSFGDYTVAAGYEHNDDFGAVSASSVLTSGGAIVAVPATAGVGDVDHLVLGASAGFGDATVKAVYGRADIDNSGDNEDQWAVSLDYVFGATTLTAFYRDSLADVGAYGIGATYDLGGGAALEGGWAYDDGLDEDAYDFGIKMTF